jgi:hypothetical protein
MPTSSLRLDASIWRRLRPPLLPGIEERAFLDPVEQHRRLQSGDPTSRLNATSPAHPPSPARPKEPQGEAGTGQRITHAHTIPNRPNRAEISLRRHEITDPWIQAKMPHQHEYGTMSPRVFAS